MTKQGSLETRGVLTRSEILSQPELWQDTIRRVSESSFASSFQKHSGSALIAGAGTSAYSALAIEGALSGSRAVPTTDLLLDLEPWLSHATALLSIARSGDSPESCGVVRRVQRARPEVAQFAITCNASGAVAQTSGVEALILDPRTNDRSLVMTSSFSNLTLAGIAMEHLDVLQTAVSGIAGQAAAQMPVFETAAGELAARRPRRFVALASRPLFACAQEAALKVLEMTAGRVAVLPETFLGLRHGPMSFLEPETLVLAFLSSHPGRRRYEVDLLAELRAKKLGYVVAISPPGLDPGLSDLALEANAPSLPDSIRAPFEIVFAQILGMHLSLSEGLDPDKPSPEGVISRVVQGVTVYES